MQVARVWSAKFVRWTEFPYWAKAGIGWSELSKSTPRESAIGRPGSTQVPVGARRRRGPPSGYDATGKSAPPEAPPQTVGKSLKLTKGCIEVDRDAELTNDSHEHIKGSAELRDDAGDQRDRAAQQRDDASEDRDRAAEMRDQASGQRDNHRPRPATDHAPSRGATKPAGGLTRQAAADDRHQASRDRGAGARDRAAAESDRNSAVADRAAAADDRRLAAVDGLTGAYLRSAGLLELDREIARTRRTREPLVVAFVDVDALKQVNDSRGHAAGDRLLTAVATSLKAMLRPYDVVIRYGGDEFVCVMTGITLATAATRFSTINSLLETAAENGSVTAGLAELSPGDSAHMLIGRADANLYAERHQRNA